MKQQKNIAEALNERRLAQVEELKKKASVGRNIALVFLYLALWAIIGDWLRAGGAFVALVLFNGFFNSSQNFFERASLIEDGSFVDGGQEKGE